MPLRYIRNPYVQTDGTIVFDCEVDLHSEVPTSLPVGARCFCREHNVDHVRGTAAYLDGAGASGGGAHPDLATHTALGLAATGHSHAGGSEAFPVGSVFIAVVSTDPAALLGYGTWEAFGAGRMLVGRDGSDPDFDTAEESGGAKTVTLTEAQMPVHAHIQNAHNHVQDAHNHNFLPRSATTGAVSSIVTGTLDTSSTISGANQPHNQAATATNQAATGVNQNTGGGGAHANLPPYIVCFFWKRTA